MTGIIAAKLHEPGYYYVKEERRPGSIRIIEIADGGIYDGRQMLADLCEYDILGPVPMPTELESLVTACSDVEFNPCSEMTP